MVQVPVISCFCSRQDDDQFEWCVGAHRLMTGTSCSRISLPGLPSIFLDGSFGWAKGVLFYMCTVLEVSNLGQRTGSVLRLSRSTIALVLLWDPSPSLAVRSSPLETIARLCLVSPIFLSGTAFTAKLDMNICSYWRTPRHVASGFIFLFLDLLVTSTSLEYFQILVC